MISILCEQPEEGTYMAASWVQGEETDVKYDISCQDRRSSCFLLT